MQQADGLARRMYWLSDEDRPAYMKSADQSLSALVKAAGEHPAETWIRYQLDSDPRLNSFGLIRSRGVPRSCGALTAQ